MLKHEKYLERFNTKWNGEYILQSEYTLSTETVKVLHTKCGNVSERIASEAIRYGCKECSRKTNLNKASAAPRNKQRLEDEFKEKLKERYSGKIVLVGEYTNSDTSTEYQCTVCGRKKRARPQDILGRLPFNCDHGEVKKQKLQVIEKQEQIKKEKEQELKRKKSKIISDALKTIKKTWGDEYEVITIPETISQKTKIKHNVCGKTSMKTLDSLLRNYGCLRCSRASQSAGVQIVSSVLDDLGYTYKREVKLEGCAYIRPLSFDFAVYDKDELLFLIEYDGEQHFRSTQRYGGQEKLSKVQARDEAKNKYCNDNNIKLLRVNYKLVERQRTKAYENVKTLVEKAKLLWGV